LASNSEWLDFDVRVNGFCYNKARVDPGRTTVLIVCDPILGDLNVDDNYEILIRDEDRKRLDPYPWEGEEGYEVEVAEWHRVSAADAACALLKKYPERLPAYADYLGPALRALTLSEIPYEVAIIAPHPRAAARELVKAGFQRTEKPHTFRDASTGGCVRLVKRMGPAVMGDNRNELCGGE
jgi:hypothetical protein